MEEGARPLPAAAEARAADAVWVRAVFASVEAVARRSPTSEANPVMRSNAQNVGRQ